MLPMKRSVRMLLFASSLWYFGEGLFGPLFAVFSEKVGGDLLDITWAWSLYLIVTGVFYVLIGKLFNRSLWKSKLIVFGYGLNTIFTFCYLLVDNTTSLLLVQAGLGLAESISTPAWDATFSSEMDDTNDTFVWGLANGQSFFVSGIAVAIGGLIANYLSFEALFILMGCIQLIATLIQARETFYVKPSKRAR
jgi:hypothetical protein